MKGTKREGARFRENGTTCRYDRGSFDIQFISCHVWQSVVTRKQKAMEVCTFNLRCYLGPLPCAVTAIARSRFHS